MLKLAHKGARDLAAITRRTASMVKGAHRFARFLGRSGPLPARDEPPALVVVQHWFGTAQPWFMMALALLLHREKRNTIVLFDDSNINRRDLGTYVELLNISRVIERLPLAWYRLSDFSGTSPLSDAEIEAARYSDTIKGFMGARWSRAQHAYAHRIDRALRVTAGRIDAFLRAHRPHYLAVTTGFQSTAGLYPMLAKRHQVRLVTLDGGPGVRLTNVDGIAAHQTDVPRAFPGIHPLEPWAMTMVRDEWERRVQGRDAWKIQAVPATGRGEPFGALLPLNVSWDTAAIHRSRLFSDVIDWLTQTLSWLLDNTDEVITVRQHPAERLEPGSDDYAERLRARFGDHPRIRFVHAGDPVNTYDLIRQAKVVLPFTSTVAMDATLLGVPVVIECDVYYRDLGFVATADSKDRYFALVARALRGELQVTEEQKQRAWSTFFIAYICSSLPSSFTGFLVDYDQWHRQTLASLAAQDDVRLLLDAIERNVPVPSLRYEVLRKRALG